MKRILLFAAAVLAVGCSKKSTNGVKLKSDLDSVAYVIGMNVGLTIDYGIQSDRVIEGVPMPRRYIAEMIMDRISASRVYSPDTYTDRSPLEYYQRGKERLWFIHPDTREQMEYLLRMIAVKGEDAALWYIRHVYLKNKGRFACPGETYLSRATRQKIKDRGEKRTS